MTQNIRQLDHIPTGPIEQPGKEMSEIVGEHLAPLHPGLGTKGFHFGPNLPPAQTPAASGEKDLPGGDFSFPGVFYFRVISARPA